MKAIALAAISLAVLTLSASTSIAQEPGTSYCFGTQCPCGNNDPTGGCINSIGVGALLTVTGSTSVAADDLVFDASRLPTHSVCLLVMASAPQNVPFYNGQLCVGGNVRRFQKHLNSGADGAVSFDTIVAGYAEQLVTIQPGATAYFQVWYRDTPANLTPCGKSANLTNAYWLTFTP